jgi:hypothetical protein
VFVLSLLEGYGIDEAEAMETGRPPPPPRVEDWRTKYLTWIDQGELPQIGLKPDA